MPPKGEHHEYQHHHHEEDPHESQLPPVHLVHHSSLNRHRMSPRDSQMASIRVNPQSSAHRMSHSQEEYDCRRDLSVSPHHHHLSYFPSPPPRSFPRWSSLPRLVLENICCLLNLSDVRNCSLSCKRWNRILSEESSDVWKTLCQRKLPKSVLKSDVLSSLPTFKGRLRAYFYAWDSNECSRNIYIKTNGFTLHRNPVAQSTDAARGKIGLSRGRHCWEVWWEGPLGTVAVVGVATRDAPLQSPGYVPLLGSNSESWGWNLVDNHLLHNGECLGSFPLQNNAPKYQTGERLRVILDCDLHTLSFERNYEFLGVAFRGLPKKALYPAVSAVYGNTEASMVYMGHPMDG